MLTGNFDPYNSVRVAQMYSYYVPTILFSETDGVTVTRSTGSTFRWFQVYISLPDHSD